MGWVQNSHIAEFGEVSNQIAYKIEHHFGYPRQTVVLKYHYKYLSRLCYPVLPWMFLDVGKFWLTH